MRVPVLRGVAAVAIVAGLVSGCTGSPSPEAGGAGADGGVGAESRRAEGRAAVPGERGVQLRVAERAAGSVRLGTGAAVAAGRGVRCRLGPARRASLADRRPRRAGSAVRPEARRPARQALRGYRLVMFDQRGTGAGALDCPALQRQMGASDLTVPAPAAVRSCAAAIGPDRRFYATADTVADIEALRAALGVARLTVDGVLVRLLRRGAVRAGASGRGEPARARLGGAELERGPPAAGEHAAERRRAARRVRGAAVRLRSSQRPGRRGPPVPRRARAARHAGGVERRRSVLLRCPCRAPRGRGRAPGRAHRADGRGAHGGCRHGR